MNRESQTQESNLEIEFQSTKLAVVNLLKEHNINIEEWGKANAKGLDSLVSEVMVGETKLETGANGDLLRFIEVVAGNVIYTDNHQNKFQLVEDRQEFADGRIRRRDQLFGTSISEKMMPNESPEIALRRGLQEELAIVNANFSDEPVIEEKEHISHSFPGLKSNYKVHIFDVSINDSDYQPNGYIEEQDDKSTYFIWKKIS